MNREERGSKRDRLLAWYRRHRSAVKKILLITGVCLIACYGLCVFLSYKAADIFNATVAKRELFPGHVTVERLSATPVGTVSFEGLVWQDEKGNLLANIPAGSFKVRLWDIVTRRIGTTTVEELTIEKGYIHLFFDENMELQNIKKQGQKTHKKNENKLVQITGITGNKKFNCNVNILDGKIEAESPGRHFIIEQVNLKSTIRTGGMTHMDLKADSFTGTVEAEALHLGGTIDFAKDVPVYDMYLVIKECNPKSLDVGIDIDNKVSVYANITGNLPQPVIDGALYMDNLDITALNFTNLEGNFHYEDGKLDADHVQAFVYGGIVDASGHFDLDEKSYYADLQGSRLKGGIAANDLMLRCDVELDLHMGEDRTKGTKEIYGTFSSGSGRYHLLPFDKISGSFEQIGKTLMFKDVVISLALGDVTTDAFSIVDGKVNLGPIYLSRAEQRSRVW